MTLSKENIIEHYKKNWEYNQPNIKVWEKGSMRNLNKDFCILEFPPSKSREMWTYATCGMSSDETEEPVELHLFSSKKDEGLVELLTLAAYYHNTAHKLYLWHAINFGKPWQDNSKCFYGLVSLPYLDGPKLENLYVPQLDENIKFLWLIPITEEEAIYKKEYGIEALEDKFEEKNFNYLDPYRESVTSERKKFYP